MQNYLLYTCEILLFLDVPLLILYLKGNWPLRKVIPPLVIIPILWYFMYAPLHELSHAAGAYLVGGKVIEFKLIPRFWLGEFARAWIIPSGLPHRWQQLTMTAFPYLLDVACFIVALFVFRRGFSRNPYWVGLAFMLLCLRPAMDFVFEPIAFFTGDRNDFYAIQQIVGPFAIWSFILISIGLAVYSISSTLSHFVSFSKHQIGLNTNVTKHNIVQKKEKNMNTNRKTAITVGVLFIIGTVAGMISLGVFTDPILGAPNYLAGVFANEGKVIIGALLELVMGVALVGMALAVYPVLKKFSVPMAIGYFGVRLVEFVIGIIGVVSLLTLVTLSREYAGAGAPSASYFQAAGKLLLAVRDWGGNVVLDVAVFPLGALILNYVLYRARLTPRWLSAWGLVGAILYWTAGLLVMFELIVPLETIHIALQAPLGLQEMVLAVWLIVKGFNPSAIASLSAKTAANELLSAA